MIHKYKILWILPVLITGLLNIYCKIDLGLDTGTVDINLEYYTYLYIMDADGSNQIDIDGNNLKTLTNSSDENEEPQFSPDGSEIVYTSWQEGNSEIYLMNADGTNKTNLTVKTQSLITFLCHPERIFAVACLSCYKICIIASTTAKMLAA